MNEKITNIKKNAEQYFGIGKDVVKEGIFERLWPLIPVASAKYYDTSLHKKLLLVAESNYMDEHEYNNRDYCVCSNPQDYFQGDFDIDKLVPEDKIISFSNDIGYKTFNLVFDINCKVLNENFASYKIDPWLGEAAFYNYCLRPAVNKNGKKEPPRSFLDKQVEYAAFSGMLEILKPDIVVFISSFAQKELEWSCVNFGNGTLPKAESTHYEFLYHPARWNNIFKGQKEKYESILRNH